MNIGTLVPSLDGYQRCSTTYRLVSTGNSTLLQRSSRPVLNSNWWTSGGVVYEL